MNIYNNIDIERTESLNIRELYVLKDMGSRNVFFTIPRLSNIYSCPYCKCNNLKNLGARHKQYKHICVIDKDPDADAEIITLDYKYNKPELFMEP